MNTHFLKFPARKNNAAVGGWELGRLGRAPLPTVQPSWERGLLFWGELYRQQAAPGEEGRPVFRAATGGNHTMEWAGAAWEAKIRRFHTAKHPAQCWVWGSPNCKFSYCASEEPLPPRAVNPRRLSCGAGGVFVSVFANLYSCATRTHMEISHIESCCTRIYRRKLYRSKKGLCSKTFHFFRL